MHAVKCAHLSADTDTVGLLTPVICVSPDSRAVRQTPLTSIRPTISPQGTLGGQGGTRPGLEWVDLKVLSVDNAGVVVLSGAQLHTGDEAAAGGSGIVEQRRAVRSLGVLGEHDGDTLVVQWPLARLQLHL